MSILRTLPSIAAACGLTLVAAAASAQTAAPSSTPAGQGQWAQHHAEMRQHMEQRRAEHLRTLHDALSIRPDQEAAWQAFAASMQPQPHEHQGMGDRGQGEHRQLTTPERLDRAVERAQQHLANLQRHAAAVKTFYAALNPQQQRTFDALAKMHMHGFGGRGGMHGGPGMKPGMGGQGAGAGGE